MAREDMHMRRTNSVTFSIASFAAWVVGIRPESCPFRNRQTTRSGPEKVVSGWCWSKKYGLALSLTFTLEEDQFVGGA